VASASEAADAAAVFWAFPKATVTVHSTRWEPRVLQRRKAANASTASTVRSLPGRVKRDLLGSSWWYGGLPGYAEEPVGRSVCFGSVPTTRKLLL